MDVVRQQPFGSGCCGRQLLARNLALVLLIFGVSPLILNAQSLAQVALSAFPADTQQIGYVNLAELRQLPNYAQIRSVLLNRQMMSFEEFLQTMSDNPAKQVNEVVVGLRAGGPQILFGIASGEFDPAQVQKFAAQQKLQRLSYDGYSIDSFGPGLSPNDLFFTFINAGLAAFGRRSDLKAILDGYSGQHATLSGNSKFVAWVDQLDGSAPEWGITTGKAAANLVTPWLLSGSKQKIDLSSVFGPIDAVLYTANWDGGFSTQITAICQNAQSAGTLARILSIWRDSVSLTKSEPANLAEFIQGMQVGASGNEVQISASGSPEVFARLLHNISGQ